MIKLNKLKLNAISGGGGNSEIGIGRGIEEDPGPTPDTIT